MTDFAKHPIHLRPPKNACKLHDFSGTPTEYFFYHEWREKRIRNGEEQEMCGKCGCYLFPEEMNVKKDNPPKLFNDLLVLLEDLIFEELQVTGIKNRIYKKRLKQLKKRSGLLRWK
jgi:hypothetical protein